MKPRFGLFERFGVELEYMLVEADTLDIRPQADLLIQGVSGRLDGDVSRGRLEWSNELALHLIELKTGRPALRLSGLAATFQDEIQFINSLLRNRGMRLLPTSMHPWMNPARESRLWPHTNGEIYAAFDRVFNCSGHGWTNLQSTHLNLPFSTPAEFRRLHTAIRLVLPLLPALAASSPFLEGRRAPMLDMRLETYRSNCARIPSVTARVIPERVLTPAQYRKRILKRIYRDLAPFDAEGILQEEWANARGAIARFERNTIEIRVLDIQECPRADLAILQFLVAVLRALVDETLSAEKAQAAPSTNALADLLLEVIARGRAARICERAVLRAFGVRSASMMSVGELLEKLLDWVGASRAEWPTVIAMQLEEGALSERLLQATGKRPTRPRLRSVYGRLADCLEKGLLFHA